jgi:hypothetical protein
VTVIKLNTATTNKLFKDKKMKAPTIKTFQRIKVVFPAPKEMQAAQQVYMNESEKISEIENSTEFQRKVYHGNFFAGAHSMIDPRFFR